MRRRSACCSRGWARHPQSRAEIGRQGNPRRAPPQRIDNTYRGSKLAPWFLALVLASKSLQSLLAIVSGAYVARSADGIPLEAYTPAGAQTVVALFALLGFSRLVIYLLCALAMVRYRSAIPFIFVVLVLEHLGRTLILQFVPIARTGAPVGPTVNLVLLGLMIVGLVLSLRIRSDRRLVVQHEGEPHDHHA